MTPTEGVCVCECVCVCVGGWVGGDNSSCTTHYRSKDTGGTLKTRATRDCIMIHVYDINTANKTLSCFVVLRSRVYTKLEGGSRMLGEKHSC